MSFNNFNQDLEAGTDAKSVHYQDFPEFESLTQQIESSLYNVNNNQLVSIRNILSQYESLVNEDDSNKAFALSKLSSTLGSLIDKTTQAYRTINELTKKVNDYLKNCELNHEDNDTIRYLRQKESLVIKLIKSSLKQFQTLQKKYGSLQQKSMSQLGSESIQDDQPQSQSQPQLQQEQSQVQITYEPVNAEELEQQTLLIQEREREIEQISQDITYINEIYGNLEDIVQEQQFTIDSIEDNVLKYNTDVHGASNELRRAERYQRRSSGRMLCCFFILIGILAFIILVGLIF